MSYIEVTKNYLQSSSIRGFPRIIKAQNVFSKFIWTITILSFLGIAIWQVSDIVVGYLKYGVQLEYASKMDPGAPFPSVTLCNQQPFAAEASVDGYMANRSFADFMSKITSLEMSLGHSLDSMKTVNAFYQNSQVLQIDAIAHEKDRLIKDCTVEFELSGRLQTRRCSEKSLHKFPHPRYLRCFTVRFGQLQPELPQGARVRSVRMVLYLDSFNYPFYWSDVLNNNPEEARHGVRVSIHPNGSLPQLDVNYIDVPPGASATLQVSTVQRSLLPRPYGDCKQESIPPIDASSPLEDSLTYAYTPYACSRICLQQSLVQRCGCLDPSLPVPRGVVVNDGAIDLAMPVAKRDDSDFVYTETLLPDGEVEIHREVREVDKMLGRTVATTNAAARTLKPESAAATPPPLLAADGPMVPYCRKWPQKTENSTVANKLFQERVACWQKEHARQSEIKYCMLGARNMTCDRPCNATEHSVTTSYAAWPQESFYLAVYDKYISFDETRKKYFSEFVGIQSMVNDNRYVEAYAAIAANRKMKDNFVEIVVLKSSWNVTEISETPSFPLSRLLSSIGGAMNLWSGITIIALLEFVELLAILVGTFFQKNCGFLGRLPSSGPKDVAKSSTPTEKENTKKDDTYGSLFTWS